MGQYAEDAIRRMHGNGPADEYAVSQGRAPRYGPRLPSGGGSRSSAKKSREQKMAKVFGARYAGECGICGEGWGAGDPIWYTADDFGEEVLAHADCGKVAGGRGGVGFAPLSRADAATADQDRPWWSDEEAAPGFAGDGGEGVDRAALERRTEAQRKELAADLLASLRAARARAANAPRGGGEDAARRIEPKRVDEDEILFE